MKGSLLKDKLGKALLYLDGIERSFSENGDPEGLEKLKALKDLLTEAGSEGEKLEAGGGSAEIELLHAERQRYYGLFASAPDGYIITDKNCVILEANRKAETLLKTQPGNLAARSFFEFIPASELEFFKSRFERLNAIETMTEWEVNLRPPGGEPFAASITVANICGLCGEDDGLRWLIRDVSERKRKDDHMRQNIDLLQGVMDNSAAFIFIKDLESRYLMVNRTMEKIAPASRFLGKTTSDLYPKEFADKLIQNDKAVIQAARAMEFEEEVPFGNEVRTCLSIKFPINDGSGSPVALCCISSDITERKRAEEATKNKLELLQGMMDYSGSYIYTKDREGRYVFANRPVENWMGCDPIGKTDFEIFPEKTAMEFIRQDMTAFEKGGAIEYEDTVAVGANTRIFRTIKFPIYGLSGLPNAVCGISTDITAKVRAEESERETRNLLKAVIENSGAAIYIKDLEGRYILTNRACEEIIGVKMMGKTDCELFPKEFADGVKEKDRRARTGPIEYETSFTVRGEERTFVMNKFPVFDSSGRANGICAIATEITERKRAETAVKESRELLQGLMDNSTAIIFIRDMEGRFIMVNRMHERITGLPSGHIIGRTPYDIFPRDVAEKFVSDDREILSSGTPSSIEFNLPMEDGVHTFIANKFPILGADGKPRAVCGISTDITHRKKEEEALRKSEAYLANAHRIAKLGNWEWDIINDDEYWSPEVCRIFDMEPVETFKRDIFLRAVHPDDREYVQNALNAALNDGKPYSVDYRIILPDGAERAIHSQGEVVLSPEGKPLKMTGTDQDITEHKMMEKAVRQSEERFRKLFEQNQDAQILFKSGTCDIIDANPAAIALYGYTLEELKDSDIWLFMGSADRKRSENLMKSGFNMEKITTYKKNGEKVIASIKGQIIRLKESEVVYCTIRDLTNIIKMEEEARYIQAKLIHANKMTSIGTLASGVAHEINNPNNFILFNSALLLDVWRDAVNVLEGYFREHGEFSLGGLPFTEMREVIPELLSGIADGSRRIKGIVDTLKDFSRLDRAGLEGEVDLNRAIMSSASILNTQINKYTENFTVSCAPELPAVKGSAQKVEQVIINLIINALHALPDRKKGVRVETSASEGYVILKVADEGAGMSKEVLERITEPFFTTKTDSGGTGLGLSISYSIIKEHNGSIEFDSAPGKGTRVTVKLPAHIKNWTEVLN